MGGQGGTVAGQCKAEGFGQAVHRVGGKHAGAGTTGGAGRCFDLGQSFIRDLIIGGGRNRRNEVGWGVGYAIYNDRLSCLHWPTRDKDGGDI